MVLGDKVLLPYRVLVIISTSEGKVLNTCMRICRLHKSITHPAMYVHDTW